MRHQDFERIYAEHAPGLLAFLVYRTGDRALAEDLMADSFERVLRARRRFDPRRGTEKSWIYAIALNCLRDSARRRATEARALEQVRADPGPPGDALVEGVGDHDELVRALMRLSEEEREALALRFGADLTLAEIARATGERQTTVEGRVYRGLGKLRDLLEH